MMFSGCCCGATNVCAKCSTGTSPSQVSVVIPTDIINGDVCSSCSTMHGTHILDINPLNLCRWDTSLEIGCEVGKFLTAQVIETFPGGISNFHIRVTQAGSGFGPISVTWQKDYGTTKPDCMNLVDESIPWVSNDATVGCISDTFEPVLISTV